jgi:predicted  nucleic acid-binding Zn-ribbon protein
VASKWKEMLGAVIKFDDEPADTTGPTAPATIVAPPLARTTVASSVGHVDDDMRASILEDVNNATPVELAAFYELVEAFNGIPDEKLRYKTALIAYQKQGGKSESVIFSAMATRKQALDRAIQAFNTELQSEKNRVETSRKQADKMDAEMQKLSEQIVQIKTNKDKLLSAASQTEQNLSDQQATFMSTADSVRAELNKQEEDLKLYLTDISQPTPQMRKVRK